MLALGAAVSCSQKELIPIPQEETGTVTLEMKVAIPSAAVETRSMERAVDPQIENIYVVLFGSNHYLNQYVQAFPVDGSTYATENETVYQFTVTLEATTGTRYVHVIANGPDHLDYQTKDSDIFPTLSTTGSTGGYWAYLGQLKNGTAKWDDTNNKWVPSDGAVAMFSTMNGTEPPIKLMRNFARITVRDNTDDFDLISFHVFRTAAEGSYAMLTDATGNNYLDVDDYISATTNLLETEKPVSKIQALPYAGYAPTSAYADETATTDVTWFNPGVYQFVYESPNTYATGNVPFIIVYGTYKRDGSNTVGYYRLELTDEDGNLSPIYRNLDYTLTITGVAKRGEANPADAVTSNGNVSSSIDAAISEVSNGVSGLYTLFTDKTFANPGSSNMPVQFMYQFVNDLSATPLVYKTCTVSVESTTGAIVDAAVGTSTGWFEQTGPVDGWYTLTFNIPPSSSLTEEVTTQFKVLGEGAQGKLFRYITVRALPIQNYESAAITGSTGTAADAKVPIILTLPENLPSSMFPLEIAISDSAKALNPDGTDMPLTVDKSASGTGSFHFTKTVSWSDYSAANGTTVSCNMHLTEATTSTKITIQNKFFNTVTLTYSGSDVTAQ